MPARVVVAMAFAVGCGRVNFDPLGGAVNDAALDDDAPPDAVSVVTRGQVLHPPDVSAAQIAQAVTFTPGTVIVAGVAWSDSSESITVSDSNGQLWMMAPRQTIPNGCYANLGGSVQLFFAEISASGSGTITATQSGGGTNPFSLFLVEYSGLVTPPLLDGSTGRIAPTASNAMDAGTLATSRYSAIVALFHDSAGFGTMIAGPGLDTLVVEPNAYALFADAMVPAGSYPITGTLPAGTVDACWKGAAIALAAR